MEHRLAPSRTPSLLLLALAIAGCEGQSASSTRVSDPWSAPLPPSRSFPSGPQVDAVSPALASPAMIVRITGSGFDAGDVVVSFGGAASMPVSVSATEIVVHPAAGGALLADGSTAVVVSVGGFPSNAATMRIGASGDVTHIDTVPPESVGDVLSMADGSVLVTDPTAGHLHLISADGIVRAIPDPAALLQTPGNAALLPDGSALIFDETALAIWRYEPVSGTLSAWRTGTPGWTDGAWLGNRLFAITLGANTVDRIEANGTLAASVTLTSCTNPTTIAAVGGELFIASGSDLCTVSGTTGFQSQVALSGETVWLFESIRSADGALFSTGIFTNGPAVARIEIDGTVAIVATPAGYPKAATVSPLGIVVGLIGGNVIVEDRLIATRVRDLGAFRAAGAHYLVTGGYEVPFLAELWADGAYRVLATGTTPALWMHVEPDADGFLIAAYDQGLVIRVSADGSLSTVVDHSAIGPVASFVRTNDGELLISSYGPDIARYDANGTLLDPSYVHSAGAAAFGLVLVDDAVYAASGDRVLEGNASEGGTAISRSWDVSGLLGITADANGKIYVADGNGTGDVFRFEGVGLVKVGHAGAAISLDIDTDGAILVADLTDMPYRMLP